MSTKMYLTAAAAPVDPAEAVFDAAGTQTWELPATRPTANLLANASDYPGATTFATLTSVAEAVTTANIDVGIRRYVSASLIGSGTLSGTLIGQMKMAESAAGMNASPQIMVKVVNSTGATLRGVAYGGSTNTSTTVDEVTTTLRNQQNPRAGASPVTLSNVAYQNGDRIVVEVGVRANNTVTTSFTATMQHGSTATAGGANDLTVAGTETTNLNPWVQFSADLTFATTTRTARVPMETPTDTLDTGAATSKLIVRCVKSGTGAYQNTLTAEIREAGALLATPINAQAVPTTEGDLTGTFDNALITDPAAVEVWLTATDGAGSATRVNLVEWRAIGSAVTPVELSGDISTTGTLSGAIEVSRLLSGTIATQGTYAGEVDISTLLSGTISTEGSYSGQVQVTRSLSGSVSAQGSFQGRLAPVSTTWATARSWQDIGTDYTFEELSISGNLVLLSGDIESQGSYAGSLEVTRLLSGALGAQGSYAGAIAVTRLLSGDVYAVGSYAGSVEVSRLLAGTLASEASYAGAVAVSRLLSGEILGQGSYSGTPEIMRLLSGAISAQGSYAGALQVSRLLSGDIRTLALYEGELEGGPVLLSGTIGATGECTGQIEVTRLLSGEVRSEATYLGMIERTVSLGGDVYAVGSYEGSIEVARLLSGNVITELSYSGVLAPTVEPFVLYVIEPVLLGSAIDSDVQIREAIAMTIHKRSAIIIEAEMRGG